ncbi:MAG: flagellar biosynthesis protein FlgN [Methylophilaceae bacterium 17-44-8]|jgi:flagella synthesis protein FlgN|nr:MAG: flagellar biosynthesis protein FlgN [Methylophilales bacterium 28-44-11]OZA05448.1 MAG: flagellar biosynthesis protein FlgN [Methylophilaceae bacterium 17-44-8]
MFTTTHTAKTIRSDINFEQDAMLVNQLLTDLQKEQAALVVSDVHTIEQLISKRLLLLQQLSLAAKNRYDALAMQGYEANEKGMANWLKVQAKPILNRAWDNFQKALVQAKEMNRLNGVLINKHVNRNQQMLSHLQGESVRTDTYGKNGQSQSQHFLRGSLVV